MMRDTNGSALDRYHELLRSRAPHERLEQAMSLTRTVRTMAVAGIRQRFPNASDNEVRIRLAVRLYGRDTACRLFGEVPGDAI